MKICRNVNYCSLKTFAYKSTPMVTFSSLRCSCSYLQTRDSVGTSFHKNVSWKEVGVLSNWRPFEIVRLQMKAGVFILSFSHFLTIFPSKVQVIIVFSRTSMPKNWKMAFNKKCSLSSESRTITRILMSNKICFYGWFRQSLDLFFQNDVCVSEKSKFIISSCFPTV